MNRREFYQHYHLCKRRGIRPKKSVNLLKPRSSKENLDQEARSNFESFISEERIKNLRLSTWKEMSDVWNSRFGNSCPMIGITDVSSLKEWIVKTGRYRQFLLFFHYRMSMVNTSCIRNLSDLNWSKSRPIIFHLLENKKSWNDDVSNPELQIPEKFGTDILRRLEWDFELRSELRKYFNVFI